MGSVYNPLTAPSYIAGTITLAPGVVTDLLTVIIAQLEPNCPGAALMVNIQSDTDNVYIGRWNQLKGALSASNYGYKLDADGNSYRSSAGAGNSASVADIHLLCAGEAVLHVEIYS